MAAQKEAGEGKQSESKKHDLARLPKDWRERTFAATKPDPQRPSRLATAVALLWSTGCRPAELEHGLQVQLVGGKQLVITIAGAKAGVIDNGQVKAKRGIEKRRLTIDANLNEATRYLAQLAATGPLKASYKRNSLRTRINEIGRNVLAKMKLPPTLSPYSFRHAMGADLKSCDTLTDEERAQVMGHLAVDSLQSYGRRRRGGGGVSPVQKVWTSAQPVGGISHGYTPPKPKPVAVLEA